MVTHAPCGPSISRSRFSSPSASIPTRTEVRCSRNSTESAIPSPPPPYRKLRHIRQKVNMADSYPPKRIPFHLAPNIPGVRGLAPGPAPSTALHDQDRPRRPLGGDLMLPVGRIARHVARPQLLGI